MSSLKRTMMHSSPESSWDSLPSLWSKKHDIFSRASLHLGTYGSSGHVCGAFLTVTTRLCNQTVILLLVMSTIR